MSTWSLACTLREEESVVRTFVAYHRALGCSELFLFFDDEHDPVHPWALIQPGVTPIRCTDAHWEALIGGKPASHEGRQAVNATYALREAASDWLIHLDADEYLWSRDAIGEVLAREADDRMSLRAPPVEAMFASLEDARREFNTDLFRRPISSEARAESLAQAIYGGDADLFQAGLLAHQKGKVFVRCSPEVTHLSVHDFVSSRPEPAREPPPSEITLLHYDAISFDHWREKMRRRADGLVTMSGMGSRRQALVARYAAASAEEGEAGLEAFFSNLYVMDPARIAMLNDSELMRAPSPAGLDRFDAWRGS